MEANWGPRLDVILYCTPRFAGISLAYLGSDLAIDVVILLMPLPLVSASKDSLIYLLIVL